MLLPPLNNGALPRPAAAAPAPDNWRALVAVAGYAAQQDVLWRWYKRHSKEWRVAAPASDLVLFQRRRGLHFPHNLRLSLWIKRVCAAQSVIYQGVHDNAYFLGGSH